MTKKRDRPVDAVVDKDTTPPKKVADTEQHDKDEGDKDSAEEDEETVTCNVTWAPSCGLPEPDILCQYPSCVNKK